MRRTRLIAVGACSIDTILTVPHFPEEDSKLRAKKSSRRRGGNTANTLEVLQQLLLLETEADLELNLVATLPARTSRDSEFIQQSFEDSCLQPTLQQDQGSSWSASKVKVILDCCLYRDEYKEAVSSYIIASEATGSRTIVNHNALPEMTFDEFVSIVERLLKDSVYSSDRNDIAANTMWFHFEGRIPDVTLKCMSYLREHTYAHGFAGGSLKISVELEKPGREGLQALALLADVVFYSRSWAEGEGYASAEMCLREQARILCTHPDSRESQTPIEQLLICTWGASGASATIIEPLGSSESHLKDEVRSTLHITHSPAYVSPREPIVDTTGAGDTFIAGVLFDLIRNGDIGKDDGSSRLKRILDFANGLAGRKILQHGFQGITSESD